MADVFISYVEEDGAIARELAAGLEGAGYTTWYYERDSLPGPGYLGQVERAIVEAGAFILIVSRTSIGSNQVGGEVVRAHEGKKAFVAVLVDLSHDEMQAQRADWRMALGDSTSINIPPEGVRAVLARVMQGLTALGVHAGATEGTAAERRPREPFAPAPQPPTPPEGVAGNPQPAGGPAGIYVSAGDDAVIRVDVKQDIHQPPDPSAHRRVTPTGDLCPICHQLVEGGWFQCPRCNRKYIHKEHQDPVIHLCSECVARARRAAGEVRVGDVLGERYEIRRLLGQGGMGKVFLAHDRELRRDFALKFLPPEIVHSPSAMADLQREAQILLDLTHENLVRLYDLGTVESLRFLKMEYVDGPSLETVVAEAKAGGQRLAVETVLAYARQVVAGLGYLHAHHVIHRDLKPGNLMVNSRGVVKILDFGIAQTVRDTLSRVSNRPTTGDPRLHVARAASRQAARRAQRPLLARLRPV